MNVTLREMGPHSPLAHRLIEQEGLSAAAVYGVVWSYCQMSDGVCRAARTTLARKTGLGVTTVKKCLAQLCKQGYLRDLSPKVARKPHHYQLVRDWVERIAVPVELFTGGKVVVKSE